MNNEYLEEWANSLRADMDKATISDKKQVALMQDEIKRAELSIQSLINDKTSLRSALSSVIKKKDQLFSALLDHKEALQVANKKILDLQSALDEVSLVSSEIDKVKKQLIIRDDKIKQLQQRNKNLESIIENQGIEGSIWKKMYKSTTADIDPDPKALSIEIDILLKKIKSNQLFHSLFKTCTPCLSSFRDLIDRGKIEPAFTAICKFCNKLMKSEKNSYKDFSIAVSEIQQNSLNGTNQISYEPLDEEYLCTYDDERISKLNSELKNIIANSESLLSKSCSNLKEVEITKSKDEEKLSHSHFNREKILKNISIKKCQNLPQKKNTPSVEIKKPAGRGLITTPKQSILKKNDN